MLQKTKYYEEFIRYFGLAKKQQEVSNLGLVPHANSNVNDDLMHNIELYDVVERKYAGFSQIVNDIFYGWSEAHPYWNKMKQGYANEKRKQISKDWTNKNLNLETWLYLFILHRVTGSAINYGKKPSGYHNTILPDLHDCNTIQEMIVKINNCPYSFYTSVGYQFPAFPKTTEYKRGGDHYLSNYAPKLSYELARFLENGDKKDLREVGEFMLNWNVNQGLRKYKFQYAAVVADIADWFPEYVNKESMFYYGTNAVECISYLATPKQRIKKEDFLDEVMLKIYEDTGSYPYNAEDVCCDFIRWVENYVKPGDDYSHIDRDKIFSSCSIEDHPFGRQKKMLDLGLIDSFNNLNVHPSDDYIIKQNNLTVEEYKKLCIT